MRKSSRDFHKEADTDPYELELDNPPEGRPTFVTFKNPIKIRTDSGFSINRTRDPEETARALLSPEDFTLWWAEWRGKNLDETIALLEDVQQYYGADPGKSET